MLKQCTAFFLLLAFLASSFSKAVIVADFYANQDYIARTLCENRADTIIDCGGRCVLRKRLAREDKQDQNNPERRAENKEVLFVEEAASGLTAPVRSEENIAYQRFSAHGPIDQPATIDHPPA